MVKKNSALNIPQSTRLLNHCPTAEIFHWPIQPEGRKQGNPISTAPKFSFLEHIDKWQSIDPESREQEIHCLYQAKNLWDLSCCFWFVFLGIIVVVVFGS